MFQFKSIKTKSVLFMTFSVLIALAVFLVIVTDLDKRRLSTVRNDNNALLSAALQDEWEDKIMAITGLLSNRLIQPMYNFDIFEIKNFISITMEEDDIRYIYIQDKDGRILVAGVKESENKGAEMMGKIYDDDLTKKAAAAAESLVQRQGKMIDAASPIMLGQKKLAIVRIGFSTDGIQNNINKMTSKLDDDLKRAIAAAIRNIFIAAVVVGIPLIILAMFFSNRLIAPVNKLIAGTKRIAAGDLAFRIEIDTRDEVGQLSDSFNRMTKNMRRYQAEKEKILKDMHDGIGGITTNIKLLSELAQKKTTIKETKKTLKTISELARDGLAEIRGFIHSLDIKEANWQDMAAELRSFGSNMIEAYNLSFNMKTSLEDIKEKPSSLLYLNLFRTYKEAITNIIKHSKAESVYASFSVNKERIVLSVKDDGIGLKEDKKGKGRGISNMTMRAKELGGQLTIFSDKGTNITLEIPLPVKYLNP